MRGWSWFEPSQTPSRPGGICASVCSTIGSSRSRAKSARTNGKFCARSRCCQYGYRRADVVVPPIEVGLLRRELVQVPAAAGAVVRPGGAAGEDGRPVVRDPVGPDVALGRLGETGGAG